MNVLEKLKIESAYPLKWWYLSFAGDEGFRGAIYVEARGLISAIMCCNRLGINPHGEVLGVELPKDKIPEERFTYRLLTKAEVAEASGEECKTIGEWESQKTPGV